ncbi:hypothetical protein QBK99_06170 [Corticibacterium sp. UT-5YL-CI-8]|nr:hypothetical protein [Tianweitania sp. UT-5YL-CI-8]
MGLSISVGVVADLRHHDQDVVDGILAQFDAVNSALVSKGLPQHDDPLDCEVWSVEGNGYSGLHAVREIAGLIWKGLPIPRDVVLTGSDTPNADDLFAALMPFVTGLEVGSMPPFAHLIAHSDAEGLYVPVDFPVPIIPDFLDERTNHLWPLGSVQRLHAELQQIATALEIPDYLDVNSDLVFDRFDEGIENTEGALWEAQPIATYSLLLLREACQRSLATGAAIYFH